MKSDKEPRISWKIEEYTHREKTPDWYWALGVIAIAGAIIATIYHDVLFAIIIVLGSVLMGYYAARKPEVIEISINEDGIQVRDFFYRFEKIQGFAVEEHKSGNRLLLETTRAIVPVMSIPLPDTLDAQGLYELLNTKIESKQLNHPISHRLIEHIGF